MINFIVSPITSFQLSSNKPSISLRTRRKRYQLRNFTAVLTSYQASDFEIKRPVGQQGYYEITDWEYYSDSARLDPAAPKRTTQASELAIRLFEGRLIAPTKEYNTRVLLKEFLQPALQIAITEAEAYKKVFETQGKYLDLSKAPIATLMGSFQGDNAFDTPAFKNRWKKTFPDVGDAPKVGSPWLVFQWEGTFTAATYPQLVKKKGKLETFFAGGGYGGGKLYLKMLMKKSLQAVDFLHGCGLSHGSIGPASLMVNTLEERMVNSLQVKLKDLGFAKAVVDVDEATLAKARKARANTPGEIARFLNAEDIYALGYAFLEVIFGRFSKQGPGVRTSQDSFKRTFEDVYRCDVDQMREFCRAESDWDDAVRFLDEKDKAGWTLLRKMLTAKFATSGEPVWPSAADLAASDFFT